MISQFNPVKTLYPFQEKAVVEILREFKDNGTNFNLLYQLPTGGGKTVIFSEIAKRYIHEWNKKVLILTHRIELSQQTSKQLDTISVDNKVISSDVKKLTKEEKEIHCYIAMVETLNNRLQDNENFIDDVGLVIVDEAHYNSFRKIFQYYENANILGVTATPLSSNKVLPLNDNYNKLLVGESISSLIENKYLANGETFTYDVNLHGLKIGSNGDFTVSSSDVVYGNYFMQEKLLFAYEEVSLGKKTLIFNPGIETSLKVAELFNKYKYKVRHLDSTFSDKDRKDVLKWFKHTPDAILTSVGILTTGFDEPTVESIIINRATRSLTLYHQMIGRGSRRLQNKESFLLIDLGNNVRRFGYWQDYINWQDAFRFPDRFLESKLSESDDIEFETEFEFMPFIREHLDYEKLQSFDLKERYYEYLEQNIKGKQVIDDAMDLHFEVIKSAANNLESAFDYLRALEEHIEYVLKQYTKCIAKSTPNYYKFLLETYIRKIKHRLRVEISE